MINLIMALMKHPVTVGSAGMIMAAATSDAVLPVVEGTASLVDIGQFIAFVLAGIAGIMGGIASLINAWSNHRHRIGENKKGNK